MDRALGIAKLEDGTIRVYTGFGVVYFIKTVDDSRILGLEDDMNVSVIYH